MTTLSVNWRVWLVRLSTEPRLSFFWALDGGGRSRSWLLVRVGANGLADRDVLIGYLRHIAEGDDGHYERQRRRNVAEVLAQLQRDRVERPRLMVEA